MTFIPDIVHGDTFSLVDCPGWGDNRGPEINIANAVNIKAMIAEAQGVRVVILLNYFSLLGPMTFCSQ